MMERHSVLSNIVKNMSQKWKISSCCHPCCTCTHAYGICAKVRRLSPALCLELDLIRAAAISLSLTESKKQLLEFRTLKA